MAVPNLVTGIFPKLSAWMLRTQILKQDFYRRPPVLIYQFGKVGSSTLRVSLRRSPLNRPIYQIHHLSEEGLNQVHEAYKTFPNSHHLGDCIAIGEALREKLYPGGHLIPKLSVITITRDPIAAMLSAFFEGLNGTRGKKFCNADGTFQTERILKVIHQRFRRFDESTNRICTWFDKELNTTLGINVFDHAFDHQRHYQVIQTENVELLLLRLEDLNRIGGTVLSEFLGLSFPLHLKKRNQRDRKRFADLYANVKSNLNLPKPVCRNIYRSRYVTHFYSRKERQEFIQKWSVG